MSRWFRFYDDVLNDPKVQRLPADLFRAWVNLLCVASANDGELPSLADVAFGLRMSEEKTGEIVAKLARAGLLDKIENGYFAPHNWEARQFKSDNENSAERMRRLRRRRDVTPSAPCDNIPFAPCDDEPLSPCDDEPLSPVTPPEQSRAEQNRAESEKKDIRAVGKPTRPEVDKIFDEDFWKVYPKREGANPKTPARKAFVSAVKSGVDPPTIIAGARRYSDEARRLGQLETPLVCQAVTWLHQRRWEDYPAIAPPSDEVPVHLRPPPGCRTREEILAEMNGTKPHAEVIGTEVRGDPGVGEDGADQSPKLQLSG